MVTPRFKSRPGPADPAAIAACCNALRRALAWVAEDPAGRAPYSIDFALRESGPPSLELRSRAGLHRTAARCAASGAGQGADAGAWARMLVFAHSSGCSAVPPDLREELRVPTTPAFPWTDACTHALQMLDAEQAFGAGVDRADVVLAVGRTADLAASFEHEWLEAVHRLNAPMVARQVESALREARRTAYHLLGLGFGR